MNTKNVSLHEELFLSLFEGFSSARKWASAILEQEGLTLSEYHVLRIVENDKKITATHLKKRFGSTAATIAQMVAKLEAKEYIKRSGDKNDKRIQYISLSPKGKKMVTKGQKEIAKRTAGLDVSHNTLKNAIQNMNELSTVLTSSQ